MSVTKETILTGYPNVISYECSKKIIEQMEKSICKIKIGLEQATGFFCKIPFPDKENMLKVLMTNNHAINENILNKIDEEISIDIYEELNTKYLNLNNRIKYTNEEYDVTIIEIKDTDEIKNYLELDDNIIQDVLNNINRNDKYKDETVYIIQYPEGKLSVSYGILEKICLDKKYNFIHKCSTKRGSSGSPILKLDSNKIIGIHKEGEAEKNFNKGSFLSFPIKEFIEQKCSIKKYNNNNNVNSNINFGISQNDELIIQNQAKKSVCKIENKKDIGTMISTGFLCMIPLNSGKKIPTLMLYNSQINENLIKNQEKIKISFDNDSTSIEMQLSKDRVISNYNNSDASVIEIKDYDKDNKGNKIINYYNFLELDENAMNTKNFKNYNEKSVYLIKYLHLKEGIKLGISFGKILSVKENEGLIIHQMDTGECSMGSPILNLKNFKVFGMHQARYDTYFNKNKNEKYGKMLYFAFLDFKVKYTSKNK